MRKEETIEQCIKSIREFDPDEQNQIMLAIANSVIEQRKEAIEVKTKQLKSLTESLENIPVLIKI